MQRLRTLGTLSPKWAVSIRSLPSGDYVERLSEPKGMENTNNRHNRAYTRSHSETVAACTGPTQVQIGWNLSTKKGKWAQAPIPNQDGISNSQPLTKEKLVSH